MSKSKIRLYLLFLLQPPAWVISETYGIRNLSVNSNRREKMKWVAIGGLVSADHPLFVVTRSSPARVWTCLPRGHRYRTDRRAKLGRTCGRMTGRTDRRAAVQWTMYSTLQEPDSLSCQQTVTRRRLPVCIIVFSYECQIPSHFQSEGIRMFTLGEDVDFWNYRNIQIYSDLRRS